tara:strand:- start:3618 stop:4289 length:672 start_codon:yes stop_codon:yes gene_type:complete
MNNTIQDPSIQSLFASTNTAATSAKDSTENPQDRFLKLLVTQMKNQDPLNPLDNAEVTSQLAQISTVTGIDKLNATLQLLVSGAEKNHSLEAAAMIGRSVLVPGASMELNDNTAIAGIELPQAVDQLTVTIMDSAGIAIRKMELGPQSAGVSTFGWDGIADSGTAAVNGDYSFSVSAQQGDQDVAVSTLAFGSVSSVSPGTQGTALDIGKLGLVSLTDIKQIF